MAVELCGVVGEGVQFTLRVWWVREAAVWCICEGQTAWQPVGHSLDRASVLS